MVKTVLAGQDVPVSLVGNLVPDCVNGGGAVRGDGIRRRGGLPHSRHYVLIDGPPYFRPRVSCQEVKDHFSRSC